MLAFLQSTAEVFLFEVRGREFEFECLFNGFQIFFIYKSNFLRVITCYVPYALHLWVVRYWLLEVLLQVLHLVLM